MAKPSVSNPKKAEDWFRKRVPMSEAEREKQEKQATGWAFWVAAILGMRLTADVLDSIKRATRDGVPFEEWKKIFSKQLGGAWARGAGRAAQAGYRLDMSARDLAQSAYTGGRQRMLQRPVALALRPYMLFDAIVDDRTTDLCLGLNGTVLKSDHPFWKTHVPPLHHRCRSSLRALTAREARQMGISRNPPDLDAFKGFGDEPQLGAISVSRIDLSQVDKRLAKLFRMKTKGGPT